MLKLTEHHLATRGEHLPPVDESLLLDYVMAQNGTFARGRRPGLEVCVPVAHYNVRGLRAIQPYAQWGYPRVPAELLALCFTVSQTVARDEPREALFHLSFDIEQHDTQPSGHILCMAGWHLEFPQQHATASRVEAINKGAGTSEERAIIEVHSHHHEFAFFSEDDDRDEGQMSFRVYGVLGRIFEQPTIRTRIGLFGHFFQYPATEFFEIPQGVYLVG